MTITVNYVSGVPGLGKTRAAVDFMRTHIEKGLSGKRDAGYIFYVAPTVDLLLQSINNLKAVLPETQHHMIRAEYATDDETRSRKAHVADRIQATLDDAKVDTKGVLPFTPGSILFMTHMSFIKLRKHDKFKDTTVLFDEARKWATDISRVNLDTDGERLFRKLFRATDLYARDGKKVAGFMALQPNQVSEKEMARLVKTLGSAKAFPTLRDLHRDLSPRHEQEPIRMQAFGLIRGSGNNKSFMRIELPSHPFRGFRRILILSADFENSQMYNLLEMEGCTVNNITIPFLDRHLPGGYAQANAVITERYRKLTIVPLLLDEEMPSKYQFSNGVILPRAELVAFKNKLNELEVTTAQLRDVVKMMRHPDLSKGVMTRAQRELHAFIKESGAKFDLVDWVVKASHKLAKNWMKRMPPVDRKGVRHPGVMILNNDYADQHLNRNVFQFLSSGKVEGRNEFMHSNVVAFHAAINPDPDLARLLKALLPNYNADDDYVVDKAIQAIGRGNIRNHKSTKRMLAIVPTHGLAKKVAARMSNYAKINLRDTEELGNMCRWSFNTSTAQESAEVGASKRERFNSKLGDDLKLYRALSKRISRLKAQLALNQENKALLRELDKTYAERASLKS